MKYSRGFTIIELLAAVAIIGIVLTLILFSVSESTTQARDADRKADLRTVQAALELYRQDNGRYPEGCNATTDEGVWSGQIDTDYECANGTREYIVGLAPEYIPTLPNDPMLNGTDSGYVYTTNPDGSVYKFMALNTVEHDFIENTTATRENPFARCGNMGSGSNSCQRVPSNSSGGGVNYTFNSTGAAPTECTNAGIYRDDFAVWGGFADGTLPKAREYFSDVIHCK